MTDLSEESVLEADRYALAVWSRLLALKKLSSSQPDGQERLGGAASGQPACVVVGGEMVEMGKRRKEKGCFQDLEIS